MSLNIVDLRESVDAFIKQAMVQVETFGKKDVVMVATTENLILSLAKAAALSKNSIERKAIQHELFRTSKVLLYVLGVTETLLFDNENSNE